MRPIIVMIVMVLAEQTQAGYKGRPSAATRPPSSSTPSTTTTTTTTTTSVQVPADPVVEKMSFGPIQSYADRSECEKVVRNVEKISYNDTTICQDTTGRECFNTYQTDFIPVKTEVCDDGFEKHCFVDYAPRVRSLTVEVCRNIPVRNCSTPSGKDAVDDEECTSDKCIAEIVCEKTHHTVEETIPSCKTINLTHCYDGIGGRQCSDIAKTECRLIKENVTKYFSPDTTCRQVRTNVCASALCEVSFEEKCQTFLRQETVSVPDESCDIRPTKDCREETKLIPKLTLVAKCVQVPRTACERVLCRLHESKE